MFTRVELMKLETKATEEAEIGGLSPSWRRAYLRLADAANNLDAMIARTEVPADEAIEAEE